MRGTCAVIFANTIRAYADVGLALATHQTITVVAGFTNVSRSSLSEIKKVVKGL
jgi:hypothetical protein